MSYKIDINQSEVTIGCKLGSFTFQKDFIVEENNITNQLAKDFPTIFVRMGEVKPIEVVKIEEPVVEAPVAEPVVEVVEEAPIAEEVVEEPIVEEAPVAEPVVEVPVEEAPVKNKGYKGKK